MTTLALIDLPSIFVPAWKAIGADQPADEPHRVTVNRVRRIASDVDAVAIAIDSPKSIRKQEFPDYKANRALAPHELADRDAMLVQLRRCAQTLRADGFIVWEAEGLEADDVIASAVRRAPKDVSIVIWSADKDLRQLVGPGVVCQSPRLDAEGKLPPAEDVAAVTARYGIGPELLGDWLALVGDSSDAIPGVPKYGPKGATSLLQRFGSLEAGIAAAAERTDCDCTQGLEPDEEAGCSECEKGLTYVHEMKPAGRKALLDNVDQARLSRQLVQLRDVELCVEDALKPRNVKPLREARPVPENENEDDMQDDIADGEIEDVTTPTESAPRAVPQPPPTPAPELPPLVDPRRDAPRVTAPSTSTAIVRAEPGSNEWAMTLEPTGIKGAMWLAEAIFNSRVFTAFPSPESVLCAMIRGRELGIPALAAAEHFVPVTVKGKTKLTMSAAMIIGLVHKSGLADVLKPIEASATRATWKAHRKGDPDATPTSLTYTIEQARKAGLVRDGSAWDSNPEDMLVKTAGVKLCRRLWPDVVGGLYFPEELLDFSDEREAA